MTSIALTPPCGPTDTFSVTCIPATPRIDDAAAPAMRIRRAGFSLVEVLVTVLVLAVVAGLVAPMMGDSDASRLRAAARLLAADLNAAQVESLAHSDHPRMVVFNADHTGYRLAYKDDGGNLQTLPNPATGTPYVVTFGKGRARPLAGVSVQSVTVPASPDDQLAFGLYGQVTPAPPADADTPQVVLACGKLKTTLTIDPTTGEITRGDIAP